MSEGGDGGKGQQATKLNPGASSFVFRPGASSFVPKANAPAFVPNATARAFVPSFAKPAAPPVPPAPVPPAPPAPPVPPAAPTAAEQFAAAAAKAAASPPMGPSAPPPRAPEELSRAAAASMAAAPPPPPLPLAPASASAAAAPAPPAKAPAPAAPATADGADLEQPDLAARRYPVKWMVAQRTLAGNNAKPDGMTAVPGANLFETWSAEKEAEYMGNSANWERNQRPAPRKDGRRGRGRHYEQDTAPPLEECAPIAVNEATRWKGKVLGGAEAEGVAKTLRSANSVLNKLSIEKFDRLSNQFIAVGITTMDVLDGCINLIVEKAQREPHFSSMYGDLCAKLSSISFPEIEATMPVKEDENGKRKKPKFFRKSLLTKCQRDFEGEPEQVETARKTWDKLTGQDLEEKESWAKKCALGHICFIGELYKKALISDRIIHECVIRLFGDVDRPDEEALECLTQLLSRVGKTLEETTSDSKKLKTIKKYYKEIERMSEPDSPLSTRLRFLFKDLLDLRKNRFVPRRKEEKATTKAAIHAQAKREEKEQERAQGRHGGGRGGGRDRDRDGGGRHGDHRDRRDRDRGGYDDRDRRGGDRRADARMSRPVQARRPAAGPATDADGWATVPSKGKGRSSAPRDRAPPADDDGWETAPSSRRGRRDRGSPSDFGGGDGRRSGGRDKGSAGGMFSALGSAGKKGRDRDRREGREDRGGGSSRGAGGDRMFTPSPSPPASPLPKSTTAGASSAGGSPGGGSPAASSPALSRDELKQKSKSLILEYFSIEDAAPAFLVFPHIVGIGIDMVLEKKEKEREQLTTLLAALHGDGVFTSEQLQKGFSDVLEFLDDVAIDIPKAGPDLGAMLARVVVAGALDLRFVGPALAPAVGSGRAAELAVALLAEAQKRGGEAKAKELAPAFGVQLLQLLPEASRDQAHLDKLLEAQGVKL
eukprot:g649.t1